MSTELPNLTLHGPEEEQADSPACHAGDSGGSTRRDRHMRVVDSDFASFIQLKIISIKTLP